MLSLETGQYVSYSHFQDCLGCVGTLNFPLNIKISLSITGRNRAAEILKEILFILQTYAATVTSTTVSGSSVSVVVPSVQILHSVLNQLCSFQGTKASSPLPNTFLIVYRLNAIVNSLGLFGFFGYLILMGKMFAILFVNPPNLLAFSVFMGLLMTSWNLLQRKSYDLQI